MSYRAVAYAIGSRSAVEHEGIFTAEPSKITARAAADAAGWRFLAPAAKPSDATVRGGA
jgi:hypothetical protein